MHIPYTSSLFAELREKRRINVPASGASRWAIPSLGGLHYHAINDSDALAVEFREAEAAEVFVVGAAEVGQYPDCHGLADS